MNATAGHNLIADNLHIILDLAVYTNVTISENAISYTIKPDYGMPQTISIEDNRDDTITVTTVAEDMDRITETMPASHMATILSDDYQAAICAHKLAYPYA